MSCTGERWSRPARSTRSSTTRVTATPAVSWTRSRRASRTGWPVHRQRRSSEMTIVDAKVAWDPDARAALNGLAFPREEYEARIDKVRSGMEEAGLSHLVAYGNYADQATSPTSRGSSPATATRSW